MQVASINTGLETLAGPPASASSAKVRGRVPKLCAVCHLCYTIICIEGKEDARTQIYGIRNGMK